uniref:Uncharacterized protein n=1 Tax=Oryza rufipogon TaxID=4529 RepID=A0A0E0P5U4_ORYRU
MALASLDRSCAFLVSICDITHRARRRHGSGRPGYWASAATAYRRFWALAAAAGPRGKLVPTKRPEKAN